MIQSLHFQYIVDTLCSRCLAVHSFCQCLYEKKKVLQPSLGCRVIFAFFLPGNVSFTGLSNSVSVRCFNFDAPWVVRHQAFYLPVRPRLFVWFPVLIRTPPPLIPPHPREGAQKFKQLCNEETGADWADWGRVYSFCCSVHASPQAYQMRWLREIVLPDDCSVEYKLCQTVFQGDYSIKTNRRRRKRMKIYKDYSYMEFTVQSHISLLPLAELQHPLVWSSDNSDCGKMNW